MTMMMMSPLSVEGKGLDLSVRLAELTTGSQPGDNDPDPGRGGGGL